MADPTSNAAHGSAMLQVKAESVPVSLHDQHNVDTASLANLGSLEQTKSCLPAGLQEMHLRGVRRYAALLGSRKTAIVRKGVSATPAPGPGPEDPCAGLSQGSYCEKRGFCNTSSRSWP